MSKRRRARRSRDLLAWTARPAPSSWAGALAAAALACLAACSGARPSASMGGDPHDPEAVDGKTHEAQAGAGDASAPAPGADDDARLPPGPITKSSLREHPAGEAWVFRPGKAPRKMPIDQAEARGLAVVDLSDSWRPYIFSEKTPGQEDAGTNDYAERYVGLADDRVDRDGDPLPEGAHNYLELYGIPPTLRVVLEDWQGATDELTRCLEKADYDPTPFREFEGTIAFRRKQGGKRLRDLRWQRSALDKAMRKAKIDDDAAAEHPDTAAHYARWRQTSLEVGVIANAQKRFRCEGLFETHGGAGKFTLGDFDGGTSLALANFEKKHDIMGWGHFKDTNLAALARAPHELAYDRMVRVITARTVSGRGIVEDGSAAQWRPSLRYRDAKGDEHTLRDLVSESTEAALKALGLDDPTTARARLEELRDLAGGRFEPLLVAFEAPPLPPYYAENMRFEAVIDRGDVWYDFPYDDEGRQRAQPRQRYPHLTVYVHYEDQKIPLIHWRTTIGSWRSEEHEGKEYFAYKNSDVGARVWKDIVAAPVWIPPASTPSRTLIKRKPVKGNWRTVVNYDETGPSYTSAYGLVAAYHIKQRHNEAGEVIGEFDNQIRTHGSVDYMSILRRYSHGCHRLYNMNAVRLFSFILQHRDYTRVGQTKIGYARAIELGGNTYRMALDTRGYRYELVEPIHVEVLEGRIRGSRSRPYEDLMPKPGVDYDDAAGEGDTDGDALDPAAALGLRVPSM